MKFDLKSEKLINKISNMCKVDELLKNVNQTIDKQLSIQRPPLRRPQFYRQFRNSKLDMVKRNIIAENDKIKVFEVLYSRFNSDKTYYCMVNVEKKIKCEYYIRKECLVEYVFKRVDIVVDKDENILNIYIRD